MKTFPHNILSLKVSNEFPSKWNQSVTSQEFYFLCKFENQFNENSLGDNSDINQVMERQRDTRLKMHLQISLLVYAELDFDQNELKTSSDEAILKQRANSMT